MALLAAGCGKPPEEIVPYVEMPERLTPGIPLTFATTLSLGGYGRGVLVTSHEGRPTKVEGNPRHPGSLGATDVFAEADIFNLYSPDRSQAVQRRGDIMAWNDFLTAWQRRLISLRKDQGEGLGLVTGRVTSPTLLRQLKDLQTAFPKLLWYAYEPADGGSAAAAKIAFGRQMDMLPRLSDADIVLSLDARFLDAGPQQIPFARQFSNRRRARADTKEMLRLYAVEPIPTLTGANADHALPVHPADIEKLTCEIANRLGASVPEPGLSDELRHFADAVFTDLKSRPGRGLVLAGPTLPPNFQALVHWINTKLNAPVTYLDPVAGSDVQPGIEPLADDLKSGKLKTLILIEVNPIYDAPATLDFRAALAKADFCAHFSQIADETSQQCEWHLPASHLLESWSDLKALDGTASIVQPLINPLYDTRTVHELVAMLGGSFDASSYKIVRDTWRQQGGSNFEQWWRESLEAGVIPSSASSAIQPGEPKAPDIKLSSRPDGLSLALSPDPSLWDGRFAHNAWLQECPKPITKQVWGNALGISAVDAANAKLKNGDLVYVERGSQRIEAPIRIQEGHATGVLSLTLGYGRTHAGVIGSDVGADVYALRSADALWVLDGIKLTRAPSRQTGAIATAVTHIDGSAEELFPLLTLAELPGANFKRYQESQPSLLPDTQRVEPAWAMVIDNTACIGCNACVLACQAENNIPVVGPEEVEWGRVMHWLRIDVYEGKGATAHQRTIGFQPVPCMHCEKAPCEPVCPVAASVHDSEGLNLQVYNRCIGTRFCEANCPYKVRRFNFFGYASGQEFKNLGAEVLRAQKNPEVTVRARGVMEKCTYCIQRIAAARQKADRENRDIGEVQTACQNACPTLAIQFGDLQKPNSSVSKLGREPQHYAFLGALGTRPRTTYLAKVRNSNPALEKDEG
ncbi:MAG TPA: 4Fe-4S dicluster domain-containing protein [Hyphomicrobiales bacterium]|nr:4Fe-4S dicluster domain-containing protein [Hyphomicrobiales bacterium]